MHYIYMITNKINNKKYIGMRTYNGDDIKNDIYMGSGKILRQAFKKYRIENFEKAILEVCTKENVSVKEKEYIEKFNAIDDNMFYNIAPGGKGGRVFKVYKQGENWHSYGKRHSNETKEKLSKANKGKKRSKEFCKLMKDINVGKILSEETKENIRIANTGKKRSDETKKKMSKIHKNRIVSEKAKENLKASKNLIIKVTLSNGEIIKFNSKAECSRHFNLHGNMILYWLANKKTDIMKSYNIIKFEGEIKNGRTT